MSQQRFVNKACVDAGHSLEQAGSTMSEADVATILRSVLRFIAQCHTKGIIYRDVKPDNFLFLTSDATTVKATDFGLSIRYGPQLLPLRPQQHIFLPVATVGAVFKHFAAHRELIII